MGDGGHRRGKRGEIDLISFFCGCGGMDLGFEGDFEFRGETYPATRFEIVRAYDNDERCVQTYDHALGGNVQLAHLDERSADSFPKADVLIGGFPCQDFATCGPKQGLKSDRGRLYLAMTGYMDVHHPKLVVGENVPGLANMRQGEVLKTILKDFEEAGPGYEVNLWTLHAPEFGIPQNRTRLFIIAVRNDLRGFPEKPIGRFKKGHFRSIRWAIHDLEAISDETVSNQSQYFRASRAKKGNGQGDETSKADQPSYTIRANAKSRVQFHYSLGRRLTVRECARLQTFPDWFRFPHSATSNIMQIGNAVPPVLGHFVAVSIDRYLAANEETP
jgi:DNA (cytosine-5)-methyltransferase 1